MPINSNLGGGGLLIAGAFRLKNVDNKNNSPIHALLSLKDSLTNLSNLRALELPWVILGVFVVTSEVGFLAVLICIVFVNGIPALCLTQISGTFRGAQKNRTHKSQDKGRSGAVGPNKASSDSQDGRKEDALVATKVNKRSRTKLGSSDYTLKNHITGTENSHISDISYELAVQTIVLGSKFGFP